MQTICMLECEDIVSSRLDGYILFLTMTFIVKKTREKRISEKLRSRDGGGSGMS